MASTVHRGYVLAPDDGGVFVQVPGGPRGFRILDDDQSWDFPPVCGEWTPLADDDPRITPADRERLAWLLEEDPLAEPDPDDAWLDVAE
jgi:hypothetical protein